MPTTTNYIWDEENLLAEADGTNTINTVYTNEPQQYGNLISSRIAGTTSYHEFDALGSTRQLTNSAGGTTDTAIYDAWGSVVGRTGATAANQLWIGALGYYRDLETAILYVRARSYWPIVGRWLSDDPLLSARPAVLGIALKSRTAYVYGRNNPVSKFDPSGLQEEGNDDTAPARGDMPGTFKITFDECGSDLRGVNRGCCCQYITVRYLPSGPDTQAYTRICIGVRVRSHVAYSWPCSDDFGLWHTDRPVADQTCWPPTRAVWTDSPGGACDSGYSLTFVCPGACHTISIRQKFEGCAFGRKADGTPVIIGCTTWGVDCKCSYSAVILNEVPACFCDSDCTTSTSGGGADIVPAPPTKSNPLWSPPRELEL